MMKRHKNVFVWDSQTVILEPDRYTDEQDTDDVDEEDSVDDIQMQKGKGDFFCVENTCFLKNVPRVLKRQGGDPGE